MMTTDAFMAILRRRIGVIKVAPTGSRVICNPPPLDTDRDFIILVRSREDWMTDGTNEREEYAPGSWAVREGTNNLIFTTNLSSFNKWVSATEVARRLNLRNKRDRIMLFRAVLYGKAPEPEENPEGAILQRACRAVSRPPDYGLACAPVPTWAPLAPAGPWRAEPARALLAGSARAEPA